MARLIRRVALLAVLVHLAGCGDPANELRPWALPTADPPGLLSNRVQAIHESPDGTLWFGTDGGGVNRFEPPSESKPGRWHTYAEKDGLAGDDVRAIHEGPDGTLWFGTFGAGVSCFEPPSQRKPARWQTYTEKDGLAGNDVRAIHESPDGTLWFGTFGGGVSHFELPSESKLGGWQTYTEKDGLAKNDVRAIHERSDGTLWFGTDGGVSRLRIEGGVQPGQSGAVQSLKAHPDHTPALALAPRSLIQTWSAGLVFASPSSANATLVAVASTEPIRCVAAGPAGAAWTGERLGGLHLRKAAGGDLRLTETQGLPAMDVRVLAPVTPDGGTVWVGTGGGAARVALVNKQLKLERTATYRDGLPTGPVAAMAARADGAVFLSYNALDAKWFSTPEYARRRATSRVYFVPADGSAGNPMEFRGGGTLVPQVEIRALALAGDTLWAATSAGLFTAKRPADAGAQLVLVATSQSPQVPIRTLKTDQKSGALWMIADAQEDAPARVIGYEPWSDRSMRLGEANGIPAGLPLHDLAFTEQGELVVLAGAQLAKGFVSVGPPVWMTPAALLAALILMGSALWFTVFRHPLVVRVRARPEVLAELKLSLSEIAIALRRLRWARALGEVRQRLGLSQRRLQWLEDLASKPMAERMPALAGLLGMNEAPAPEELCPGLWLLRAKLGSPEPLSKQPIPLIGVDRHQQGGDDESRTRSLILEALERSGHRFELPFFLFCRDADVARRLVPEPYLALVIDDPMARELMFAHDPSQTLAGLLLTRGLWALSPYSEKGAVSDPAMFYGRDRVLRELLQAASPQCLLVGPRRVEKSSLLRRLADQLPEWRPELQPVLLDLLGIDDPTELTRRLARIEARCTGGSAKPHGERAAPCGDAAAGIPGSIPAGADPHRRGGRPGRGGCRRRLPLALGAAQPPGGKVLLVHPGRLLAPLPTHPGTQFARVQFRHGQATGSLGVGGRPQPGERAHGPHRITV